MSSRSAALRGRIPLGAIERGQLLVIVCLAVLTVAAWGVTIHQARTMDMPMGIALRAAVRIGSIKVIRAIRADRALEMIMICNLH